MRTLLTIVVVVATLNVWQAMAAEPAFSAKPSATRDGDRVKIGFAVSAPTDVEVAVLGADGKIVCHLAAGVLGGKNPPPAPLAAGLVQNIAWDGRDDFGKPAAGGPSKFRVRAGMKPAFDGFVGASPYILDTVRGMTVDAQGNLYVLNQSIDGHGGWPFDLRVYDRRGNYLRSLMPFRAGMRKEDAEVFRAIEAGGGQMVPRNFQSTWPHFYPTEGTLRLAGVTPDGTVVLNDDRLSLIYRLRGSDGGPAGRAFEEAIWPGKGPRMVGSAAAWPPMARRSSLPVSARPRPREGGSAPTGPTAASSNSRSTSLAGALRSSPRWRCPTTISRSWMAAGPPRWPRPRCAT